MPAVSTSSSAPTTSSTWHQRAVMRIRCRGRWPGFAATTNMKTRSSRPAADKHESQSRRSRPMKLYGFPASPNTWKVRAVAKHLGIPLEEEFVDLTKGASHTPDYLALNPTGRTPALVDGDFVLWESTAIMQYIASVKPNTLWPEGARLRADIVRWQSWELVHWSGQACQPLTVENLVKQLVNLGAPNQAIVDAALASFHREAKVLD